MKIKRTVAADMRAAMQIIRDTHGPDAVILSKRSVAGGIEVVSAIDVDAEPTAAAAPSQPARKSAPRKARRGTVADLEEEVAAATTAEETEANRTVVRAQQLLESAKAASRVFGGGNREPAPPATANKAPSNSPVSDFETHLAEASRAATAPPKTAPTPVTRAAPVARSAAAEPTPSAVAHTESPTEPHRATTPPAIDPAPRAPAVRAQVSAEVSAELKRMRQVMQQQLAIMGWQAQVERSPASVALLRDLHALGFDDVLAQRLCQAVSLQADPDTNWQLARHWLGARLMIADGNPLVDSGVSAVFGASGTGKTSTVVKLAAQYALQSGPESMAFISTDTDRVGGTASLSAFASVLGVPVHTVTDLDDLGPLIESVRQQHARVLIDTGNGERNRGLALKLAELSDEHDFPLQNYVVLAANAAPGDSLDLLGALGRSLPVAAILSKIDEAPSLGGVLSAVIDHQLPVAAIGVGPDVPDGICVPDVERLITLCENAPASRGAASSLSEPALAARFGASL